MIPGTLLAWALLAGQADADTGRKAFARCANCHAAPDPAIRSDRIWLDHVKTTA